MLTLTNVANKLYDMKTNAQPLVWQNDIQRKANLKH